jgi:hypothetical protein
MQPDSVITVIPGQEVLSIQPMLFLITALWSLLIAHSTDVMPTKKSGLPEEHSEEYP